MDETEMRLFDEKREKMKERWKKKLIPERQKVMNVILYVLFTIYKPYSQINIYALSCIYIV